jgi:hypothetical protein
LAFEDVAAVLAGSDAGSDRHVGGRHIGFRERLPGPFGVMIHRDQMGHTSKPDDARRVLDFVLDQSLAAR